MVTASPGCDLYRRRTKPPSGKAKLGTVLRVVSPRRPRGAWSQGRHPRCSARACAPALRCANSKSRTSVSSAQAHAPRRAAPQPAPPPCSHHTEQPHNSAALRSTVPCALAFDTPPCAMPPSKPQFTCAWVRLHNRESQGAWAGRGGGGVRTDDRSRLFSSFAPLLPTRHSGRCPRVVSVGLHISVTWHHLASHVAVCLLVPADASVSCRPRRFRTRSKLTTKIHDPCIAAHCPSHMWPLVLVRRPDSFKDDTWKSLLAAVRAIHGRTPVATTLELLYKAVKDFCDEVSVRRRRCLRRLHEISLGSWLAACSEAASPRLHCQPGCPLSRLVHSRVCRASSRWAPWHACPPPPPLPPPPCCSTHRPGSCFLG